MYFLIVTGGQIIYKYMFRGDQKFGGSRRGHLTKFHRWFSLKSGTAMAKPKFRFEKTTFSKNVLIKALKKF